MSSFSFGNAFLSVLCYLQVANACELAFLYNEQSIFCKLALLWLIYLLLFVGNVLFASALHGWCFSIPSFVSKTLLSQLGLPASSFSKLCSALWGDKYIRRRKPKQQAANEDGQAAASLPDIEVRSSPFTTGQQRMAEQLLFEPIWKLYKVAAGDNASSETNFKEKTQAQSNPEEDDRLARLCGMARSLSLEGVEELEKELRRILSATRQQRAAEKSKIKEEMVGDIVAAFMAKWLPVGETLLVSHSASALGLSTLKTCAAAE